MARMRGDVSLNDVKYRQSGKAAGIVLNFKVRKTRRKFGPLDVLFSEIRQRGAI